MELIKHLVLKKKTDKADRLITKAKAVIFSEIQIVHTVPHTGQGHSLIWSASDEPTTFYEPNKTKYVRIATLHDDAIYMMRSFHMKALFFELKKIDPVFNVVAENKDEKFSGFINLQHINAVSLNESYGHAKFIVEKPIQNIAGSKFKPTYLEEIYVHLSKKLSHDLKTKVPATAVPSIK